MNELLKKGNQIIDILCEIESDIDKANLIVTDLVEDYSGDYCKNEREFNRVIQYIGILKDYNFVVADQIKKLRDDICNDIK